MVAPRGSELETTKLQTTYHQTDTEPDDNLESAHIMPQCRRGRWARQYLYDASYSSKSVVDLPLS